jgi:polysaccharide biosynthesis transport protein
MNDDLAVRIRDWLGALKRRRLAAGLTFAVGFLAAFAFAFGLPARYESQATILIEQQEVPTELVRSAITSFADQRIQVISQRVMTSQNLLDIMRRYDLYADDRDSETREAIVERMRDDISFRTISADVIDPRSGMPREATIAFAVAYTSRSPELAAKVANELTSLYLNENLTSRTRLAQEAAAFLQSESERMNREIAGLEAKLATFKETHNDALPELSQLNYQLLDRTEQELRLAESQLTSLDQQRVFLEAQLVQIKPNSVLLSETGERILSAEDRIKVLRSQLASARALYAEGHPDIVRIEREIAGLLAQSDPGEAAVETRRRLERTQADLAQARERYTEDHPDVLRLQRELASLQSAYDALPQTSSPRPARSPDNPAYVQLQAQLSATINDQAAARQRIGALRAQIADYEGRLRSAPQIEREYAQLTRDYANAQAKYQEIRAKSMEAQVSQNLETDRKGERFTLIEPPLPPGEPVSPNRPLLLVLGVVLSTVLAALVVVARELLDATVRGRSDVLALFDLEPLATVPRIETSEDLSRAVRVRRLSLGSTGVALALMLLAVHFMIRPLDSLWWSGLRRLGLF